MADVAITHPDQGGLKDLKIVQSYQVNLVAITHPDQGGLKVLIMLNQEFQLHVAITHPDQGGLKADVARSHSIPVMSQSPTLIRVG